MRYRCPFCRTDLHGKPPAACPACGRSLRVAASSPPDVRRARRRACYRINREAHVKLAELRAAPNPRALYSPRVLLGAVILLACLGSLLIGMADRRASGPEPGIPHRRALRDLNVLAIALGRYRFHVGRWPNAETYGLLSLCNDYREPGWIGPYIRNLRDDPWNTPYHYAREPDGSVRLCSRGPDGELGTPDDLRPDPAAFDVGTDWTNGWVRAIDRLPGVSIITSAPEPASP